MKKLLTPALAITLLFSAAAVVASPLITLAEFQALFPAYVNHAVMNNNGFDAPCVDANGTIVLNVNIADIMGQVTGPVAIAMVCQAQDYPAFTPSGPVTFSEPGIALQSLASVPGHPDAFAIEYVVPFGVNTFTITIENTGWPEGCIDDILDLAAWDLAVVSDDVKTIGSVKALY